jgi:hypothetical protein
MFRNVSTKPQRDHNPQSLHYKRPLVSENSNNTALLSSHTITQRTQLLQEHSIDHTSCSPALSQFSLPPWHSVLLLNLPPSPQVSFRCPPAFVSSNPCLVLNKPPILCLKQGLIPRLMTLARPSQATARSASVWSGMVSKAMTPSPRRWSCSCQKATRPRKRP